MSISGATSEYAGGPRVLRREASTGRAQHRLASMTWLALFAVMTLAPLGALTRPAWSR